MTMKTLSLLCLIIIFSISCSENDQIEIIDNLSNDYTHLTENRIDPFSNASLNTLWDDLMPLKDILVEHENEMVFSYRLYVGLTGEVEKIMVLLGKNKEVNEYIFNAVKGWQLQSYQEENKSVRYSFDFNFKFMKDENGKNWIIPLNNIRSETSAEEIVYIKVDEMPFPVGGLKSIMEKIKYPKKAKEEKIEGRVFIKAVINKDGIVVDSEIIKGIGGGCNEAALQAVKDTRFSPGRKNGVPVNVEVTVPILFKLR